MNDLNYFLNTFLSGYGHRFGVGVEQVNYFLGEWFIKNNRGVTAKDICDIAAHLVEFYECMEKNGNVDHAYVKEFKENAYSDVWRWASYAEQYAEGEYPFWF